MKEQQSPLEAPKVDRAPEEDKKERKVKVVDYISESSEFDTAYKLLLTHEYSKAVSLLEAAAEKGYPPAFAWLHRIYQYGRIGISQDSKKASYYLVQMTPALAWYETFAEKGHWQACSCLGYMYRFGLGVKENTQKSLQYCDIILKQKPKDPIVLNDRGSALLDLKRIEEALSSFETALAIDPKNTIALHNRGLALSALKRPEEALASYEAALAIDPKFTATLANRGLVLCNLKRFQEALASYEAELTIDPKNTVALERRGNVLLEVKRFEEALASYEAALAINPKSIVTLGGRGNVLLEVKRFEEALASYEAVLAIDPQSIAALVARGNALYELKRFEPALTSYEAALVIDPKNAVALNNRGSTLRDLNRPKEALASFEAALAIDPKFTGALHNRGGALSDLNRPEEALASYEAALAIDPKDTDTLHSRGNVLRDLKRFEAALASYEAALAIDPKHLFALVMRMVVLKELGTKATTTRKLEQLFEVFEVKDSKKITDLTQTVADFRDSSLATNEEMIALAECLLTHPALTTLHLDRTQLTDEGLAVLTEALSNNMQLTTLTFSGNPKLTTASARSQMRITAYLHRNRLLAADTITTDELRDVDFSILGGEDMRTLLLRHQKLDVWDFSHKQLDAKAVILRSVYLPTYPALHVLNLKGNGLGDKGAEQIGLLLKTKPAILPSLEELILSDNSINNSGLEDLAEAMTGETPLKILNLSQNTIMITDVTLKKTGEQFSKNKRLEQVILSGNQLLETADALLTTDNKVKESKTKTDSVLGSEHGTLLLSSQSMTFFRSKPVLMKSVTDPTQEIDQSNWVVALVCRKNDQHAMLYLEGMRESGQRFLMRYEIVAPGVWIKGEARVKDKNIKISDLITGRDKYDILPFKINRIQGKALQNRIQDQKASRIPFSLFYNLSTNKVNCTAWCRRELTSVGIGISETNIPSVAVGGGYLEAIGTVLSSLNPFGAKK